MMLLCNGKRLKSPWSLFPGEVLCALAKTVPASYFVLPHLAELSAANPCACQTLGVHQDPHQGYQRLGN